MKRFFRFLAVVALVCGFVSTAQAESGEKKEGFFKAAFRDMKQSAKLQRQIDRANYQAIKLESKAFYQEQKRLSNPKVRSAAEKERMERQLAEANARLERAKGNK
jgi:hypothetical protein